MAIGYVFFDGGLPRFLFAGSDPSPFEASPLVGASGLGLGGRPRFRFGGGASPLSSGFS